MGSASVGVWERAGCGGSGARTPDPALSSLWPSGPSNLAPRTMALRQRLNACLMAIHCFHEACLDDECAFYTSRAPPSGPTRVCSNPVATLLEWQDALVSLRTSAKLCLPSKHMGSRKWGRGCSSRMAGP